MHRARSGAPVHGSNAQSLLLLLHGSGGVSLESSIGNFKAAQSIDPDIQNQDAKEGSEETHENT